MTRNESNFDIFLNAVERMRTAQKNYFYAKCTARLKIACEAEQKVDAMIREIRNPQMTMFNKENK